MIRSILICAIALVTLSACSSTKLTDSWQAPTLHRKDMNNVLVVAMTDNITNRILFERGFVDAMKADGITATASYDAIGNSTPTKDSVTAYVKKNAIRYVVVTIVGGVDVTHEQVPESVRTYYTGPYYGTYGGFWSGYGNTYTMVRDPYTDTKTTVLLTTSIYEVKSEKLVWVGRSSTFEIGSIDREAGHLANQVVRNIAR